MEERRMISLPNRGRYGVVDVQYAPDATARSALAVYRDAAFAQLIADRVAQVTGIADYEPGAFFRRELPALRAVLPADHGLDLLLVDSYVDLDPTGRPGLGLHVSREFAVPVVGIAKSGFRPATHAIPVRRGAAQTPLFVTATGIDLQEAAEMVARMAGPFRLPDAVRHVDGLARGTVEPRAES
jgi:deoxyribonuclease V